MNLQIFMLLNMHSAISLTGIWSIEIGILKKSNVTRNNYLSK